MRLPYIRVFGRTYLYGRKVKFPALALLAVRDVIILPFFKKVSHCLPTRDALSNHLNRYERKSFMKIKDAASQQNRYFSVDINPDNEIDILSPNSCEREGGRLFYLDVCRNIETMSDISGLTFYISARTPSRLPRYGRDVVLLLLADELYAHRAYHHRLLAIFRCLPARPIYLDGIPNSAKHLSYLAHYSYKYFQYARGLLSIMRNRERLYIRESATRTMMIPLGCFARFEPDVIPICNRDFDYAFLGSVTYNANEKKWFHALMESPKEFCPAGDVREHTRGINWLSMARIYSYNRRHERKYQQSVELC